MNFLKKFSILFLTLFLVIPDLVLAGEAEVGTTAANFLKITPNTKGSAMGEAEVAVADDVNAIYANPAGLSKVTAKEATFTHLVWLEEISYESIGYAQVLKNIGVLGVNLAYLYTDIDKFSETYDYPCYKKEGTYKVSDMAITLAYSRKISEIISAGISIKSISDNIDGDTVSGIAVDIGGLYNTPIKNLTAGLSLRNLGGSLGDDSLPVAYILGAGYKLYEERLTLVCDLVIPVDNKIGLSFGAEYWYAGKLALRLGGEIGGELGNFGAGIGYKFKNYQIDYALIPYGGLGLTHRISFSAKF